MEVGWLRLALEIDPMADPVAGRISEVHGPAHTFTGWTQLGRILGDIIATSASGPAGRTTTGPVDGEGTARGPASETPTP